MSTFDERPPFKKRIVTASLTEEQRAEFDQMKARLNLTSDGALIKRALADLSHSLSNEPTDPGPVVYDPPLTQAEGDAYWAAISDDPEPSDS